MTKTKITLITFTKDSEKELEKLLKNIHDVVDEIIVIDSYSKDATIEVAKSFGARIFLARPLGYVEAYIPYALKKATYEWILYLDADEALNKKLRNDLKLIIEKFGGYDAFSILRIDVNNKGKSLLTFYPLKLIRLFKKSRVLFKGIILKQPKVYGTVMELPEDYFIIHYLKHRTWLWSLRKSITYARLRCMQYYQPLKPSKAIGKALYMLSPFTIPILYLYHLVLAARQRRIVNVDTMISIWFDIALHEGITFFLQNIRSESEKHIAKLVEKEGLTTFLKLKLIEA